jgi:hypothetical protein
MTTQAKPQAMPRKPKTILRDDPEQSKLFIKKAREIGADEQDSSADTVLGQLHKKAVRAASNQISARGKRHPRLKGVMNLRQV